MSLCLQSAELSPNTAPLPVIIIDVRILKDCGFIGAKCCSVLTLFFQTRFWLSFILGVAKGVQTKKDEVWLSILDQWVVAALPSL